MNKIFKEHIKNCATLPNNPCNYYSLVYVIKSNRTPVTWWLTLRWPLYTKFSYSIDPLLHITDIQRSSEVTISLKMSAINFKISGKRSRELCRLIRLAVLRLYRVSDRAERYQTAHRRNDTGTEKLKLEETSVPLRLAPPKMGSNPGLRR
jgi:hypothetical protein